MSARSQASNVVPISRAIRARQKSARTLGGHTAKPISVVRHGQLRQSPRLFDFVILGICVLAALAIGRLLPRTFTNNAPPPITHMEW